MNLAMVRKVLAGGAPAVAVVLLVWAAVQAQVTPNTNSPKMAVLHATVTITGGLAFTGSYDDRLPVRTCAEVARGGTGAVRRYGRRDVQRADTTAQSRRQSRVGRRRPHLLSRCCGLALSRPRHIHGLQLDRDTDGCGHPSRFPGHSYLRVSNRGGHNDRQARRFGLVPIHRLAGSWERHDFWSGHLDLLVATPARHPSRAWL